MKRTSFFLAIGVDVDGYKYVAPGDTPNEARRELFDTDMHRFTFVWVLHVTAPQPEMDRVDGHLPLVLPEEDYELEYEVQDPDSPTQPIGFETT